MHKLRSSIQSWVLVALAIYSWRLSWCAEAKSLRPVQLKHPRQLMQQVLISTAAWPQIQRQLLQITNASSETTGPEGVREPVPYTAVNPYSCIGQLRHWRADWSETDELCTATLINNSYALTAAHCVWDFTTNTSKSQTFDFLPGTLPQFELSYIYIYI